MEDANETIADVDKLDMADSETNSNETQVLKDRLVESERRAQLLETRLARLESDRQDTGVRDRGLFHPVIDVTNVQNNNHEHQFEHDNAHYPTRSRNAYRRERSATEFPVRREDTLP